MVMPVKCRVKCGDSVTCRVKCDDVSDVQGEMW